MQASALLSLESQRDSLLAQLQQYDGLDGLHRSHMVDVHARHAKALKDAQVSWGQGQRRSRRWVGAGAGTGAGLKIEGEAGGNGEWEGLARRGFVH